MPEPGGRLPAPGDLALVQAFVNTRDIEDGLDHLPNAAALTDWLRTHELLEDSERADEQHLRRAHALREAVRNLAAAHNSLSADTASAAASMNDLGRRGGLAPVFTPSGEVSLRTTGSGVDAALARVVAAVYGAVQDGTWARLKACERGHCRWVFYDGSRNRSGRWCSMAVCGSREKSRRAYRRGTDVSASTPHQ